ncbi:FAD-linked oxidoreductase [Paxillus ammoniavirescens]|nr:FAD-linked oxidoreductase [Paxillus ammoniavirescens]
MYMIRRATSIRLPVSARRRFSSPVSPSPPPPRSRTPHPIRTTLLLTSTLSLGALTLGLYTDAKTCPSSPFASANSDTTAITHSDTSRNTPPPLLTLFRTYFVYGLISIDTLVDHAPEIFDVLVKVPLLGGIVEAIVRRTFFDHFVGGDTAHRAWPLLSRLRGENKGALLAYSIEVDEDEAAGAKHHNHSTQDLDTGKSEGQLAHKRIVAEMIQSIDVAADFEDGVGIPGVAGRRTWVAVKLTALVANANALRNLSLHLVRTRPELNPRVPFPGTPESSDLAVFDTRISDGSPLTTQDVEDLKGLYDDLNRICTRAKERRVRVILDAEYSWYQPAIDAFGHALMERFNKGAEVQPLVYVTYQAYLRRTPTHLARSLTLARQNNYALGVKLVRGAYHPHELAAHSTTATSSKASNMAASISISPEQYPPVHLSKPNTDACYNECAKVLVRAIADDLHSSFGSAAGSPPSSRAPHIGVLFGTHNWISSELILGELVKNELAREGEHKGTLILPSEVAERFTFGQLYGMSDSLTNYLVGRIKSTTPCVIKYVPYGALVDVMPYLSRRAIENKSVLGEGGAVRERKEAARSIWKRVFGGVGL